MGQMEVITRAERQRTYSERAAAIYTLSRPPSSTLSTPKPGCATCLRASPTGTWQPHRRTRTAEPDHVAFHPRDETDGLPHPFIYNRHMTPSRIKTAGHHVARYVLPIISAIWLFWTMLETKRMQGWFEAQDDFRHASRPFFAFPTAEFAFAAIFVIASFASAAMSRPRIAAVIALMATAFVEIMWIGMTR